MQLSQSVSQSVSVSKKAIGITIATMQLSQSASQSVSVSNRRSKTPAHFATFAIGIAIGIGIEKAIEIISPRCNSGNGDEGRGFGVAGDCDADRGGVFDTDTDTDTDCDADCTIDTDTDCDTDTDFWGGGNGTRTKRRGRVLLVPGGDLTRVGSVAAARAARLPGWAVWMPPPPPRARGLRPPGEHRACRMGRARRALGISFRSVARAPGRRSLDR